jgi:hypothetical protein
MDYVKAEPGADKLTATVMEVKDEEHLEPPIFCAIKSEPQVRFSLMCFVITVFVSGMFCFRMRMTLNRKGPFF